MSDNALAGLGGNNQQFAFNKKLCFEARDTLFDCVAEQPNSNKFRCPDQLYAYEMWCPTEFRRIHGAKHRKDQQDEQIYNRAWIENNNREKQTLLGGRHHYVPSTM